MAPGLSFASAPETTANLAACADFQRSCRKRQPPLPFGPFGTIRIKAFNWSCCKKLTTRAFN